MNHRLAITWVGSKPFAPDRLRSLLEFASRSSALRVQGLPPNLYTASERLSKEGGRLEVTVGADSRQQPAGSFQASRDDEAATLSFSVDVSAVLDRNFPMTAAVDLLVAGARILAAERGMVAVESALGIASLAIATWLSPVIAKDVDQSQMAGTAQEQWDGAVLILHQTQERFAARQAIRTIIASDSIDAEALTFALRGALSSSDWEVRASAMLGAARRGLQLLGLLVKRMEMPEKGPGGVTGDVRKMLLAMHKASLLLLSGVQPPGISDETRDTRVGTQAHLLRCIAGLSVSFHDDFFLLTTALTQPLPLSPPCPASIPAGLQPMNDGSFRNVHTGSEFVWVPPVAHWLGAGDSVRERTPDQGFFLAKAPLESAPGKTILAAFDQIKELSAEASSHEGLSLVLPAADEWEMAARGPDARLFPWGNGWDKDALNAISPWGLRGCTVPGGQWTAEGLRCGDAQDPRCAARFSERSPAAIRWKVVQQMSS